MLILIASDKYVSMTICPFTWVDSEITVDFANQTVCNHEKMGL